MLTQQNGRELGRELGTEGRGTRRLLAGIVAAAGMAFALPAAGQLYQNTDPDEHYEWERDEGVHEEEWYDPSDWWDDDFDGETIDYESDWYEDRWDDNWGYYDDDYGEDDIGADDYYYEQMGYADHGEWSDEDWGMYTGYGDQWEDDAWYVGDDVNDSEFDGYNEWQSDYEDWFDDDEWYDDERSWQESNSNWFGDRESWYNEESGAYGSDAASTRRGDRPDNRSMIRQPGQAERDRQQSQRDRMQRDRMQQDRAQRDRMQRDRMQRDRQSPRMQSWQQVQPPRVMLEGEFDGFRRVRLDGERESHTVTRIRLENGNRVLVNLGPRMSMSRLDLEPGDRISIMGRLGRIDNQNVVLAERLKSGDRVFGMNNWRHSDKVREQNDRARQMARGRDGERSWSWEDDGQRERTQRVRGEDRLRDGGPDSWISERRRHGTPWPSNLRDEEEDMARQGEQANRQRSAQQDRMQRDRMQRDRVQRDRRDGVDQQWTRDDGRMQQRPQAMGDQRRGRMHPDAERVRSILEQWPEQSQKSAKAMLKKYGKPAAISKEMLVWTDTGPFIRTEVYGHEVQHNFPRPHTDVLQQYVNFRVPPEKMDDIAKFDGSVVVYLTDGLMASRCHKEAMNVLTLNIAADIAQGRKTVKEAREAFARHAEAYMNGERPQITQELTFDTTGRNTDRTNRPGEEFSRGGN